MGQIEGSMGQKYFNSDISTGFVKEVVKDFQEQGVTLSVNKTLVNRLVIKPSAVISGLRKSSNIPINKNLSLLNNKNVKRHIIHADVNKPIKADFANLSSFTQPNITQAQLSAECQAIILNTYQLFSARELSVHFHTSYDAMRKQLLRTNAIFIIANNRKTKLYPIELFDKTTTNPMFNECFKHVVNTLRAIAMNDEEILWWIATPKQLVTKNNYDDFDEHLQQKNYAAALKNIADKPEPIYTSVTPLDLILADNIDALLVLLSKVAATETQEIQKQLVKVELANALNTLLKYGIEEFHCNDV